MATGPCGLPSVTRAEWLRALDGTPDEDGVKRLVPMNSIGWIVGHLAWQEQRNYLTRGLGRTPVPVFNELVANGGPATTPPLSEMLAAWHQITRDADSALDPLTTAALLELQPPPGPPRTVGDAIRRTTYHYWFHMGEILAIRQILGHQGLPDFVGKIERDAPYRAEGAD